MFEKDSDDADEAVETAGKKKAKKEAAKEEEI